MVTELDYGVGNVTAELRAQDMWAGFDEGLLPLCRPISLLYGESL
jgi:hypothetical protein